MDLLQQVDIRSFLSFFLFLTVEERKRISVGVAEDRAGGVAEDRKGGKGHTGFSSSVDDPRLDSASVQLRLATFPENGGRLRRPASVPRS